MTSPPCLGPSSPKMAATNHAAVMNRQCCAALCCAVLAHSTAARFVPFAHRFPFTFGSCWHCKIDRRVTEAAGMFQSSVKRPGLVGGTVCVCVSMCTLRVLPPADHSGECTMTLLRTAVPITPVRRLHNFMNGRKIEHFFDFPYDSLCRFASINFEKLVWCFRFFFFFYKLLSVCLFFFSLQNRQPVLSQMAGVSNMNLPLRPNVPNQVSRTSHSLGSIDNNWVDWLLDYWYSKLSGTFIYFFKCYFLF